MNTNVLVYEPHLTFNPIQKLYSPKTPARYNMKQVHTTFKYQRLLAPVEILFIRKRQVILERSDFDNLR